MEKKVKTFVLSMSLLLLYQGTLADSKQANRTVNSDLVQGRDHDAGSSSYQAPPQQSSSSYQVPPQHSSGGYGAPAPEKPTEIKMDRKFRFIVAFAALCIMTLGVVWMLVRVSWFAELGAAGTTRSAFQSFWDVLPESISQDFTLTDLASKILNPYTIHGILDRILESSK